MTPKIRHKPSEATRNAARTPGGSGWRSGVAYSSGSGIHFPGLGHPLAGFLVVRDCWMSCSKVPGILTGFSLALGLAGFFLGAMSGLYPDAQKSRDGIGLFRGSNRRSDAVHLGQRRTRVVLSAPHVCEHRSV